MPCLTSSIQFWHRSSRSIWRRSNQAVHAYAERTGRKMGDVVNPLRVAVTGQGVGPGLYDCLAILGRDLCRARVRQTVEMLRTGEPPASPN